MFKSPDVKKPLVIYPNTFLLYGSCVIYLQNKGAFDATETGMHRIVPRTQRIEHVRKEEVLRKMGTEKDICS